ncbi:phosphatidate cytidylyltransferase [Aliiroseovarius marinus]|uniref:phosphatidate cytidylyltransferase n=1 Tax=Aliiroseovarius marinus TaxID=2500159 RepID=UPI003D7DBB56
MNASRSSSKWADLAPRVLSAFVMAAIAAGAIWIGGLTYMAFVALVIGLCMWEFARLLRPDVAHVPVFLGAAALVGIMISGLGISTAPGVIFTPKIAALFLAPVLGMLLIEDRRLLFFTYSSVIMLAGLGFVAIGPGALLIWFVLIIVMSDVAGYFAGRMLGGPKFWPRISPKKTWSGTIAGWIGAGVLGLIGVWMGYFTPFMAIFAPLVAFAGQMGDIAQSAIKRKVGVKDSSNLIPGHGGVLDRFDAMIGASAAVVLISAIGTLVLAG